MQDDHTHPIPRIGEIDVFGIRENGGAELAIIIASPLDGGEYSQSRILDKLDLYIAFIASDEFQAEAGPANPQNTTVAVHIHPDSAPEIFELLERCRPWLEVNSATLRVEALQN
jgi:hypothetical protein